MLLDVHIHEFESKQLRNVVAAYFKGQCVYFTTAVCFQCRSTFYIVVFISSVLAVCTTLTVHTKNIQLILV